MKQLDFFGPLPQPRLPRVGANLPAPTTKLNPAVGLPANAYRTTSGRMLDLSDPERADINIEDIAHNLARLCRFGGAVDGFYSVASHCVYVSRALDSAGFSPYLQAAGLLHDATEAYLGDVVSGLKQLLPEYQALEDRWEARIQDHFDVHWSEGRVKQIVKDADLRARLAEIRDLFRETPYSRELLLGGDGDRQAYETRCVELTPDEAEWAWLARARELGLW